MGNLLEAVNPFCFVYKIDIRNLVEEQKLSAGEQVNGTLDLLVVVPL